MWLGRSVISWSRQLCLNRFPLLKRTMAYTVEERGSAYSFDYRIFFKPLNPIKQDVKKGKLRFVYNCSPHHGYMWNYGALPQTWEDPGHVDNDTGCKGDNDPLDVCEIGYRVAKRGEIRQVKILGTLAMIDEGETDWKILAIDTEDPLAKELNDISDIETHMPGFIKWTVDWFTIYKVPAGKPRNTFAFDGKPQSKDFAVRIVQETHQQWKRLIEKTCEVGNISCMNTTNEGSPDLVTSDKAKEIVSQAPPPGPPNAIDPLVDKWYYVPH